MDKELIERAVNTAYPSKLPYKPTPADYMIAKFAREAERERIATVASFTVKLEGNTVVVDAVDWDRLWQALIGDTQ